MKKYWFLIVIIVGAIIVGTLLFNYFTYVEATLYINASGILNQEDMKIDISNKSYSIKDWKVFIPHIKKGVHDVVISFNGRKIYEKKLDFSKRPTELKIDLPKVPEISELNYSYDKKNSILTMKWKVSGDIKPEKFEIFKDGNKLASTDKASFSEHFGPFETHFYEIKPVFFGNVYGVSYKTDIGPFSKPANLSGRVVVPYDINANRIKVKFDTHEIKLDSNYKFEIRNVIPDSYKFEILIDDRKILTRTSTVVSGDNELIFELPELPTIKEATATVENGKFEISWNKPENEYYVPIYYVISDSNGNIYKTENNYIELNWETSPATYNIIPVFFEGINGEPHVIHKPKIPYFKVEIPQKYNKKSLKSRISIERAATLLVKVDDGEWKKLEDNELKLQLDDGKHRIHIKAVDNFNQTFESSYTIFVDSTPPLPPIDLKARYEEGKLEVSWLPSISEDVKDYSVKLNVNVPITYSGTNLVVYDLEKLKEIPDELQISVTAEDYFGNTSQKSLKVEIPKIPKLLKRKIEFLNEGNDAIIDLEFEKFNGKMCLYLDNKELYITDLNEVRLTLSKLEFDKEYILSAQLENEFGKSVYMELFKFRTPLPKPEILSVKQTGVNEVVVNVKASGDYLEYHVNSPNFSITLQSKDREKLITLPQPGKYTFSVKAFTYDNQSLESDTVQLFVLPAQSKLPSIIDKKVVISKEGGPYLISKDILIKPEGELVIGRDVELALSGKSTIKVYGKLFVNKGLKISIAKSAQWKGLEVYKNGHVELRNLEFSGLPIFLKVVGGEVLIKSSNFYDMEGVVKINEGKLSIESSSFVRIKKPIEAAKSSVSITSSTFSKFGSAISLNSGYLSIVDSKIVNGMDALDVANISGESKGSYFENNITGLKITNSSFKSTGCTFASNVKGVLSTNSQLSVIDSLFKSNLRAVEIYLASAKTLEKVVCNKTGELITTPVKFLYDDFIDNKMDIYIADGPYPVLAKACKGIKNVFDFKVSPLWKDKLGNLHERGKVIFDNPDKVRLKLIDTNKISLPLSKENIKVFDENNTEIDFELRKVTKAATAISRRDRKIILLVDLSDSMIDQPGENLMDLRTLIDKIRKHFAKNIEIYVFNSNWVRKVDKKWEVKESEIWGYTPLYDTIFTIVNSQVVDEKPYGLIVLTDGLDSDWEDKKNGSINSAKKLLNVTRERNLPIVMVIYGETNIFRNSLPHVNKDFGLFTEDKDLSILDWKRKDLLEEIDKSIERSYNLCYELNLLDIPESSKIRIKLDKAIPKFDRILKIPYYPIETNREFAIDMVNITMEATKSLIDEKEVDFELNY